MPQTQADGPELQSQDRRYLTNESPSNIHDTYVSFKGVVPAALRTGRFVPRQAPGRREPARVTAGAFRAAGLPVPDDPRHVNAYQLSQRRGWPWSPAIDEHVRRRGAELVGHGGLVLVDIDVPAAVDDTPMINTLRWLSDRAVGAGEMLDLSAMLAVRTPGHPESAHLPGWHLWFAADPGSPVRMGTLPRCRWVEFRGRGTCPGSPGYIIEHAPGVLPVLPAWIAALAGPPRPAILRTAGAGAPGRALPRFRGAVARLLQAERGERNSLAYWAARVAGEAGIDPAAAEAVLVEAASRIGLAEEDGEPAVRATIRSGLIAGGAVARQEARHG